MTTPESRNCRMLTNILRFIHSLNIMKSKFDDFKSTGRSFCSRHPGFRDDFEMLYHEIDESMRAAGDVTSTNTTTNLICSRFYELRRALSSCVLRVGCFNHILWELPQPYLQSDYFDFTVHLRLGCFECIFRDCNQDGNSKTFEHVWDLIHHLYFHHEMGIDSVGEGRQPSKWQRWETGYFIHRREEYLNLSWGGKKDYDDWLISQTIDWDKISEMRYLENHENRWNRMRSKGYRPETSRSLPEEKSVDNLRYSLLIKLHIVTLNISLKMKTRMVQLHLLSCSRYSPSSNLSCFMC